MISQRSQRRLFGYAIATAVAFAAPAYAKAEDKGKPASTAAAKPEEKGKPEKSTAAKPPVKTIQAAKPKKSSAVKAAANKPIPLPRARPRLLVASAIPMVPAKATLSPIAILPTTSFSPITPAAAATLNPGPADAPAYTPPVRKASLPVAPLAAAESSATPAADVALVKQALDLVRRGKTGDASTVEKSISDPLARKLVEWTILRGDENDAGFDRLASFSIENPSWPNAITIRKRAESALWDEKRSAETVRNFFASSRPMTGKGKFALARALLAQGDTPAAAQLVRQAWREDTCSAAVERAVMESFGEMLRRADHKARMDRRFYDDDPDAGMRMAQLLGGTDLLIGRARKAVVDKASNARALLDAVPESGRGDAGYLFHKAQLGRREDKPIDAARLLQAAPRSASQQHNLDEWWVERRLVARKLLDEGEYQAAYMVARDALPPTKDNPRSEHEFTPGWIALRFANNAQAAYQHFARVGHDTANPITLARGEYWQARALDAMGRNSEARAHYQAAAQHSTAYYGQIARAHLGLNELPLRRAPELSNRAALMNLEVVRAVQLLYAVDARDLVVPFASDLAENALDIGALAIVAEVARKYDDARAMLLIGKGALRRGFALEAYAFPTNGIPDFRMVGPAV